MESYINFINRINQLNEGCLLRNDFSINMSLCNKVDENSLFKKFYGDTTVFNLKEEDQKKLNHFNDELYEKNNEMFSERLDYKTFHVTLHDLSNGNDLKSVSNEVFENEIKLLDVLSDNKIKDDKINFESGRVINMVNTSLVLTVLPVDEIEYQKLCCLYEIVDKVKRLPYLFTPHITLAYFSPSKKTENQINNINKTISKLNEEKFIFNVDVKDLFYQKFISMKNYYNIFSLVN